MSEQEESLESLEIRSAAWYRKKLKYAEILYEVDGEAHIATITLNRPEKMNAMNHLLRAELFHALKHADLDAEVCSVNTYHNTLRWLLLTVSK